MHSCDDEDDENDVSKVMRSFDDPLFDTNTETDDPYTEAKDWDQLLVEEARLVALLSSSDTTDEDRQKLVPLWWAQVALIFQDRKFLVEGRCLGPLAVRLQGMFRDFADGRIPDYVSDVVSKRNQRSWRERKDRAIAVACIVAAKDGRIKDPSYNKTVTEAYGLASERSTQKWFNDEDLRREFPGVFNLNEKTIKRKLFEAGERFKLASSTHEAIAKRAKGDSQ